MCSDATGTAIRNINKSMSSSLIARGIYHLAVDTRQPVSKQGTNNLIAKFMLFPVYMITFLIELKIKATEECFKVFMTNLNKVFKVWTKLISVNRRMK